MTANARLVVHWLRVGYCQGNMNSDNTSLAGRTIDYGPFGFMESYNHAYQPFTSDATAKNFAFGNQAKAMHKNVTVLGTTVFKPFIQYLFDQSADLITTTTTSSSTTSTTTKQDVGSAAITASGSDVVVGGGGGLGPSPGMGYVVDSSSTLNTNNKITRDKLKFALLVEIENIASDEFWEEFNREFDEICRRKLGFMTWNELEDRLIWNQLLQLLER